MGYIANTRWHKENFNTKWLFTNNFKYSREYSDSDSDAYVRAFPIYKYKFIPLYECLLILYADNGEVIVKVQDRNKNSLPQFNYDSQNNYKKFINRLEKVIAKELKRLGIKPLKNVLKDERKNE